ncbi:Farnesyl diphosphate synthase [wastewater metagenome]|uniref:Farnesyl diphosphate synthase n=2 Tax=unclassified sequences TaxID=12908 RepID=A0A5B8RCZ0_9ZZZZ|nr:MULTISPECIES: farnesyl diphosphate synthase [Arhodomonas]MCS4504398.1 (2E,6E)-farnesyl diphosphate synthase [Arhodomonas aquaeolei]QEA04567.1 farnesyl diphosphate synthase [uncultured organism]
MAIEQRLSECRERVEAALEHALPPAGLAPARLHEAMRYAVLGNGKRLRPLLVYLGGEALDAPAAALDAAACAVECIHCYSLVHDDLPAMDDDDLRRGRPTCHRAYDDATAILVGDALQALAFRLVARTPGVGAEARVAMLDTLATAAGSRGLCGGQAMDLAAVGHAVTEAELEAMHIHKTGALIRASVRLGALCGEAPDAPELEQLDHYAKCIGLAFQVQDDILDVDGDADVLGKASGADARLDKPTYPALLGLSEARAFAAQLRDDALASLEPLGERAEGLREIANYVIERDH